ncbi:hypothetical protein DC522_09270 [Microvirga sp. KLBC 81]|uniref:hypothetical protein n=1 Tax=Microvirga sp. KLBC 81 TaxID=1862707 RepID=UPI000D510A2B|nr:hypothetical protein [Microvirga sp. KLBC 81]PVE24793.1 hypothetical protein DC522_09270 [Microvirga sp. KLBC 81]
MNRTMAHDVDYIQHTMHPLPANASCLPVPSLADALADPRSAFRHPAEVVSHPLLSRHEKRTILISWARDEILLEQVANGGLPELKPKSQIDAVTAALRRIDPQAAAEYRAAVASIRARRPLCRG